MIGAFLSASSLPDLNTSLRGCDVLHCGSHIAAMREGPKEFTEVPAQSPKFSNPGNAQLQLLGKRGHIFVCDVYIKQAFFIHLAAFTGPK